MGFISRGLAAVAVIGVFIGVPATASALTFTVDPTHGPECDASRVCGSIAQANDAVRDGDVVDIKPNARPYVEPPIRVMRKGVTFSAQPGTVTITGNGDSILKDPALDVEDPNQDLLYDVFVIGDTKGTNGDNTILRGLRVQVAPQGGRAVFIRAADVTIENSALSRDQFTDNDVPVLDVDDTLVEGAGPTLGTQTIKQSVIVQYPRASDGLDSPAIWGGDSSSLAIIDSFVASGAQACDKSGSCAPAVRLGGNELKADSDGSELAMPNKIVRSVIAAAGTTSNGVEFNSAWDSDLPKKLVVDSAVIDAGANGTGLQAITHNPPKEAVGPSVGPITLPAFSHAGDIVVELIHATVAGAERAIVADARPPGGVNILSGTGEPASRGNVYVDADRSIIHGAVLAFNRQASNMGIGTQAGNESQIRLIGSDSTREDSYDNGSGGLVQIMGADDAFRPWERPTHNPDEKLFVNPAKGDWHLLPTAPVVDLAGPVAAGESEFDFDQQARLIGSASDRGSDEYNNQIPLAAFNVSTATPKERIAMTFDGTGSRDAETGGTIKEWRWTFGDGTTLTTTTPTVQKKYTKAGAYSATLTVVDSLGAVSTPATPQVLNVRNGIPPKVAIQAPKAGQRMRVQKVKVKAKTATGSRMLLRSELLRFAGIASDDTGLATVQLALRRVSAGRPVRAGSGVAAKPKSKAKTIKPKTAAGKPTATKAAAKTVKKTAMCTFFDGKSKFLRKSCKNATFFRATLTKGKWAYRVKPNVFLRTGTYVLMARAIDNDGNISKVSTRRFSVR